MPAYLLVYFVLAVIVALVVMPPDYDPAIRLKEWVERKRAGKQ
jgi:hypothetical protein